METAQAWPERPQGRTEPQNQREQACAESLEPSWRADVEQCAHDHREVPRGDAHQIPFGDVLCAAEPEPPRCSRLTDVRETALGVLAAQPTQPVPSRAPHPA